MREAQFEIVPLGKQDRSDFSCGSEALDHYFKTQVTQDIRRRVSACDVALERATGRSAGYYTLSAADIPLADLPPEIIRRLPRYPSVPAARIGRLAVDRRAQGRRLGGALLLNAAVRAMRSEVAVFALVVDAKDERAAAFYRHYGFLALACNGHQLIAPLATFRKVIA
ncbi:MAG: GNAT family N-acetyltransferase [Candidatus Competibacteraceae bacterium]